MRERHVIGQVTTPVIDEHVIVVASQSAPQVFAMSRLVDGEVDQRRQVVDHQRRRPMAGIHANNVQTDLSTEVKVRRQIHAQLVQLLRLPLAVPRAGLDEADHGDGPSRADLTAVVVTNRRTVEAARGR